MEVYLDNGATTKVCPEAIEAANSMMSLCYGNPSATYKLGRDASLVLKQCRTKVAKALGAAKSEEVFFTSCGSESDNWAVIRGSELMQRKGKHIISSMTEHDAIRKSLEYLQTQGFEVTLLAPEKTGEISPEAVKDALRPDTVLVSLMMVNNETGAITDIRGIKNVIRSANSQALLHTDAVQGFLKVPFKAKDLGADMISVSGHKIHALKGIGALYVRSGLNLKPYIMGGGQENGLRSGTEPMPQIASFAAAAEVGFNCAAESQQHMTDIRRHCVDRICATIPSAVVNGGGAPHILSLALPGYRSEVLMNYLEAKEIYVSKGSACKRGKRSHVLEAMNLPAKVIDGTIRVSFSRMTSMEEADYFVDNLVEATRTLRAAK